MKKNISIVLSTILAASAFMTGCGSDSSGVTAAGGVSGVAVKDTVVGGTATLYEANATVVATTVTDSSGAYSFPGESTTNRFVTVTGGIMHDENGTATGPNTMNLSAPASVSVANPLTSLIVTIDPVTGAFDQNASVVAGLLAAVGTDTIDLSDTTAILNFVAQNYTGATSGALQNVGQASLIIANSLLTGATVDTLREQVKTLSKDVNVSDSAAITTALTNLTTALTNAGSTVNAATIADDAVSIATLETQLVTAADSSALLPLNITGVTSVGGQTVTLVGNTFTTINRDALSSEEELSSFFNVSFNANMTTLRSRTVNDAKLMVLVKQTNSEDENRSVALEIDGIEIVATKDTNLSDTTVDSTLAITVKNGANITVTAKGLSSLTDANAVLSSGDIVLDETNGSINFNVQTLLNAFNSTTVNNYVSSLNNYARQTDASYAIYVGLDGNFTTGLTNFTAAAVENSGLTLADLNVTAYEGFKGSVVVGDATPVNHAPTFTSADTAAPTMYVGTEVTSCTIAQASDADANTLTYSATGLPAGLVINATTGIISGTPTTVTPSGSGVVTVTDGVNTITKTVTYVVQAAPAEQVNLSSMQEVIPYFESNNWNTYVDDNNNSSLDNEEVTLLNAIKVKSPSSTATLPKLYVDNVVTTAGNEMDLTNGKLAKISFFSDASATNSDYTSNSADLGLEVYIYTNGYQAGDVIAVDFDNNNVKTYTITGNEN